MLQDLLARSAAIRGPESTRVDRSSHRVGAVLAGCAAVWHAMLVSKATNDNFLHLTLAEQLLAGEWPVRDFFDHGWVLQYVLSALAQVTFGDRLLSEAVIVGAAWAASTYLVFGLVRALTGSTTVAVLCAVLLIVAAPRGYAYPKGIIYALAAALWWRYASKPTPASAVLFGTWAAVAFYWRPDHGFYVAVGFVLVALAVHGIRPVTLARCALAGTTAFALTAPFLLYVHLTVGLSDYVKTGVVQAQAEHTTHGTHAWPLVPYWRELFTIEPATDYAPVIAIRWTESSSPESRQAILARYGLTYVSTEDERLDRVRLSAPSLGRLRQLLNEPVVEDTAGVERSSATLPDTTWSAWRRWTFTYSWLRIRMLPSLSAHARASEIAVALFYVLPLFVLAAARPWLHRYLPDVITGPRLAAFALFALVVNVGLVRTPYTARAVDVIVLQAVLFGCCIAAFWRTAGAVRRAGRWLLRVSAVTFAVIMIHTAAGAGQFGDHLQWLAGRWTSLRLARGAWSEVYGQLVASPPISYYENRPAPVAVRLAAYVQDCVPRSERLLVLWFAPEIYYYSDRLMAQRHLVFLPEWAALEHEQRMTFAKITRFSPPIVLARQSALEEYARPTFPRVIEYVEREYERVAIIDEEGEQYVVLARRDRPRLRRFGEQAWPCYSAEPSAWWRVGREVN